MRTLRFTKGRNKLLLDRNRDMAFLEISFDYAGLCMFLDSDDLAELGKWATGLSRELKREEAYKLGDASSEARATR